MGKARRKKYNTLLTGITTGIALPLTAFLLLYLVKYGHIPFFSFLEDLWKMKLLMKILSLCGFLNLLAFLGFYRKGMDLAARGVLMATFGYALVVLVSRLAKGCPAI